MLISFQNLQTKMKHISQPMRMIVKSLKEGIQDQSAKLKGMRIRKDRTWIENNTIIIYNKLF